MLKVRVHELRGYITQDFSHRSTCPKGVQGLVEKRVFFRVQVRSSAETENGWEISVLGVNNDEAHIEKYVANASIHHEDPESDTDLKLLFEGPRCTDSNCWKSLKTVTIVPL